MQALKTGEVASRAGVKLDTIHYYERRGLLPKPPRTGTNYRAFPPETVRRVQFIKRAQELGFTLAEIGDLLSLRAAPRARCSDVSRRAQMKVRDIDEKIRTLESMRDALTKLIRGCSNDGPAAECPILEALDSERGPGRS